MARTLITTYRILSIEVIKHYRLSHGFAVGFGMQVEAEISNKLGYLSDTDLDSVRKIIGGFGIKPVKYSKKRLLNIIKNDKKNHRIKNGLELVIPLVLPESIGKVRIRNFSLKELDELL